MDYKDIVFVITPQSPNTCKDVVRNMKRMLSINIGVIYVSIASQRKLTSAE
jgi:predicted transcriptional regulator